MYWSGEEIPDNPFEIVQTVMYLHPRIEYPHECKAIQATGACELCVHTCPVTSHHTILGIVRKSEHWCCRRGDRKWVVAVTHRGRISGHFGSKIYKNGVAERRDRSGLEHDDGHQNKDLKPAIKVSFEDTYFTIHFYHVV